MSLRAWHDLTLPERCNGIQVSGIQVAVWIASDAREASTNTKKSSAHEPSVTLTWKSSHSGPSLSAGQPAFDRCYHCYFEDVGQQSFQQQQEGSAQNRGPNELMGVGLDLITVGTACSPSPPTPFSCAVATLSFCTLTSLRRKILRSPHISYQKGESVPALHSHLLLTHPEKLYCIQRRQALAAFIHRAQRGGATHGSRGKGRISQLRRLQGFATCRLSSHSCPNETI